MLEAGAKVTIAIAVAVALSGCLQPSSITDANQEDLQPTGDNAGVGRPHVVVAIFDTGINPYHPAFRAVGLPEPALIIPDLPTYETVDLSFETAYDDALQKDRSSSLEPGKLYWFRDTRILGYSHYQSSSYRYAVLDEEGHGTAAASMVLKTNPDAIILAVETFPRGREILPWAANQSWIDVFSISSGPVANIPAEFISPPPREQDGLRTAVENGKLVVGAAGNEPVPPWMAPDPGAPWSIGVGGAWSNTRGETAVASKTPDFVSEFVVKVASKETTADEWYWSTGTSYGAPFVAGVVSRAIYEVRETWGHGKSIIDGAYAVHPDGHRLTNTDVRLALNRTAAYWSPTDYSAPSDPTSCLVCTVGGATVPITPEIPGTPVGPWLQMGWGFVNESTVPALVSVLLGEIPLPEKPEGAKHFMDQIFKLREIYWGLPRPR
ncbi:MAG TPA: S8/S53 family peptidase [Candidatus Thermoplasmatota archaeon]|nr:S8/S53 family peptidase [Candidatus Thermoplasmatota archaeon]